MQTETEKPGGDRHRIPFRQRPAYPILFMFVATFCCTGLLVGVAKATRERVQANRRLRFERALLSAAFPDEISEETPARLINTRFRESVEPPDTTPADAFRVRVDGTLRAYAIPLEGKGYWDTIKGVIAIAPDRSTVVGIAFHEQNETPGLGAEITKPYFRDRFSGRRCAANSPVLRFVPAGTSVAPNEIHAISGATQTVTRLQTIIDTAVARWRALLPDPGPSRPDSGTASELPELPGSRHEAVNQTAREAKAAP